MNTVGQISLVSSGIIVGMITLQTAIVAPALFKYVNHRDAAAFLRNVFPKMFLSIGVLSLISLLLTFLAIENTFVIRIVAIITLVSMIVCYSIIPATNRAKDAKKEFVFRRLHSVSVFLTAIVLLSNCSVAFR